MLKEVFTKEELKRVELLKNELYEAEDDGRRKEIQAEIDAIYQSAKSRFLANIKPVKKKTNNH